MKVFQEIGVQPLSGGPCFVIRNALNSIELEPFKIHNRPSRIVSLHNTTVKKGILLFIHTNEPFANSFFRKNLIPRVYPGSRGNIEMAIVINSKTKLTYKEYVLFPPDGKRHEIIDGEHVVTPAPETYHQTVSRRIQFQLYRQIEERGLGEIYNAPTDLQFSDIDIVQPDLLVVLAAKRRIITPKKIKGVPDLVVEILSESSANQDRVLKKELYQKAGVPEYWIVDPEEHAVEQYLLAGGAYELSGKHQDEVSFKLVPGVVVDLKKVW